MTSSSDEAYRQAGVDLQRARQVVDIARSAAGRTATQALLGGIGGFSGAFALPPGYQEPILLTACDGVGTKLKLAFTLNRHNTVGIDLVAMSVNDILVNGGRPLAFLDYVATSRIEPDVLSGILEGIAEGCRQAGCTLAGGETAEMPGFYPEGEYDLAGFCVGLAERAALYPKPERIQAGAKIIGLASSGFHSNGYSLIRKVLADHPEISLAETPPGWEQSIGETLLTPTQIYVEPVLALLDAQPEAVAAMVHVTGGGFYDNIPRVLPADFSVRLHTGRWPVPPVFSWLQALGGLSNEAMWHTFNGGLGFLLIVAEDTVPAVLQHFETAGVPAWEVGEILLTPGRSEVEIR